MRDIIIGTGFYASKRGGEEQQQFFRVWLNNTLQCEPSRILVVDNSQDGLKWASKSSIIEITNNLGHSGNSSLHGNRLMGWSMSWIIPAMVAYSENCDFVYKEQDCLAFGDWLPQIRQGRISYGRNSRMPCEQSLFYIERDTILPFVAEYMSIPDQDNVRVPEDKMAKAACNFDPVQFSMPFGREQPRIFYTDKPWYAQKFTADELNDLRDKKLV